MSWPPSTFSPWAASRRDASEEREAEALSARRLQLENEALLLRRALLSQAAALQSACQDAEDGEDAEDSGGMLSDDFRFTLANQMWRESRELGGTGDGESRDRSGTSEQRPLENFLGLEMVEMDSRAS